MVEVYSVSEQTLDVGRLHCKQHHRFTSFKALLVAFILLGNLESDSESATVVVLGNTLGTSQLDQLNLKDKILIVEFLFKHLNVIVVRAADLSRPSLVSEVNECGRRIDELIQQRIRRVEIWTGTGHLSIEDISVALPELGREISTIISTMSSVLIDSCKHSPVSVSKFRTYHSLILQEMDYFAVFFPPETRHHREHLCNVVGDWAFPAHELTNDDLAYCAYLILSYALRHVDPVPPGLQIPSPNTLLGLVFMVRASYNSGNPFHNFRHAVDVLQACFHYVLRLGYLPKFKQFSETPMQLAADKGPSATDTGNRHTIVELTPTENFHLAATRRHLVDGGLSSLVSLTPLQTLALLVAALGHDVGHPGVTNAFLIKHNATASLIYNDHSVLELFHASVYVNKILSLYWPSLLTVKCAPEAPDMTVKNLIISSILATDMAEHFEYIDKLTKLKASSDKCDNHLSHDVRLVSSLLIKCADISNVTRPLRVSSQWAVVLKREFDEVAMIEERIADETGTAICASVNYSRVASQLQQLLADHPTIYKGQLFFIDTFAEKLFDNIAELLPELRYTCDIIRENKEYWLHRKQEDTLGSLKN